MLSPFVLEDDSLHLPCRIIPANLDPFCNRGRQGLPFGSRARAAVAPVPTVLEAYATLFRNGQVIGEFPFGGYRLEIQ